MILLDALEVQMHDDPDIERPADVVDFNWDVIDFDKNYIDLQI